MSKMIPMATTVALRANHDLSVDIYGIPDCEVHVPTNYDAQMALGVYAEEANYTYADYLDQKIWIEWSPSKSRLKNLGIFTEDSTPIIARFKNLNAITRQPEIIQRTWIKVPIAYIPNTVNADEFVVTDILMEASHSAVMLYSYIIAPRRARH